MIENKEQNSCQYADELMVYLYDEIGEKEKSVFEFHLAECSSCADELASFSAVRFSIGEWRDLDFKTLETPSIINPAATVEPSFGARFENKPSLIAQIRELIGLSPAWMSATAAALVVCFGLFLTVSYLREDSGSLALNEANSGVVPAVKEIVINENRSAQKVIETTRNEESKPPTVSLNNSFAEKSPKISPKTQVAPEAKAVKVTDNKAREKRLTKPNLKKAQTPAPTLIADEDEYEDESLRLSDIFRGVGGG